MTIEIKSAEIIDTQDGVQKFLRSIAEELKEGQDTCVKDAGDGMLSLSKSTGLSCRSFSIPSASLKDAAEASGLPWEEGYEDRVIPWWASDQRVDRHGDIVEQTWDFTEFDSNPVVLYGHQWEAPPIGSVIGREIKSRRDKDYSGPALRLLPLFATKEQYPAADVIFRLAKARFLRTGSVGFMPGEVIRVDDAEERQKLGLGNRGVVYRNNSLLEWTICSVPANSGAHQVLASAKSKGLLKSDDINIIRELRRRECLNDECPEKSWLDSDNILCSTWYSIFPEIRLSSHSDIEKPVLPDECVDSAKKYETINFTPPKGAKEEAQKGLEWRDEYGRGGTEVGVARARDISNGRDMSPETIGRMVSFFARHEVDKDAEGFRPGEEGYPSNGRIAWALWGGDPGRSFANKVKSQMNSEDENKSLEQEIDDNGDEIKEIDQVSEKASDQQTVMMQLMAASITRQDRLIERIDTLIEITSDMRETVESKNSVDFPVETTAENTVLSSALEQCLKMTDEVIGRNN